MKMCILSHPKLEDSRLISNSIINGLYLVTPHNHPAKINIYCIIIPVGTKNLSLENVRKACHASFLPPQTLTPGLRPADTQISRNMHL